MNITVLRVVSGRSLKRGWISLNEPLTQSQPLNSRSNGAHPFFFRLISGDCRALALWSRRQKERAPCGHARGGRVSLGAAGALVCLSSSPRTMSLPFLLLPPVRAFSSRLRLLPHFRRRRSRFQWREGKAAVWGSRVPMIPTLLPPVVTLSPQMATWYLLSPCFRYYWLWIGSFEVIGLVSVAFSRISLCLGSY